MIIYLYVKQHSETKLKYFGKTTKSDPFKYLGSGDHWIRHLKKHGKHVKTTEIWGFDDQSLCTAFALKFSAENNIVESKEWANKIPENGMDGGKNHEGMASVRDKNGNYKLVPVQELQNNGEYVGVVKGTVTVKDKHGKNYRVSLNDPRYLSGELVNNRAKMCYVTDSNGNERWIKTRDYDKKIHTYLRDCPFNDYAGYAKTAKGAEKRKGKCYHLPEQIERARQLGLSNKGKKATDETRKKLIESRKKFLGNRASFKKECCCPTCNKKFIKKVNNNTQHNVFYCSKSCAISMSRRTNKVSCPECGIEMDKSNFTKYHKPKCHHNDKK